MARRWWGVTWYEEEEWHYVAFLSEGAAIHFADDKHDELLLAWHRMGADVGRPPLVEVEHPKKHTHISEVTG